MSDVIVQNLSIVSDARVKPVMNQCPCLGERPRLTLEAHRSRSSCGLTVPLAQEKDGDSDGKSVTARRSSTQVMSESKCSKTQIALPLVARMMLLLMMREKVKMMLKSLMRVMQRKTWWQLIGTRQEPHRV